MTGILGVLGKAMSFVAIIVLGYVMKRVGVFQTKDFYVLSKILIRVTLPCAIIVNFSKNGIDSSMLILCVIGILCNLLMVLAGFLMNLKGTDDEKAFAMLNMSGYNVGNFVIPYVQSFLGPVGFTTASLFDVGNAIMGTGGNYSLASAVKGGEKTSVKMVLKTLASSIPFLCYVVMIVVSMLHIQVPGVVLSFAETGGNANGFLSFFMIGIGLEICADRESLLKILKILVVRYGISIVLALGLYWGLPMSLEIRQTLAIVMLAPVTSICPAYTGRLGGDVELSSTINSVEIVISIILITCALMLLL